MGKVETRAGQVEGSQKREDHKTPHPQNVWEMQKEGGRGVRGVDPPRSPCPTNQSVPQLPPCSSTSPFHPRRMLLEESKHGHMGVHGDGFSGRWPYAGPWGLARRSQGRGRMGNGVQLPGEAAWRWGPGKETTRPGAACTPGPDPCPAPSGSRAASGEGGRLLSARACVAPLPPPLGAAHLLTAAGGAAAGSADQWQLRPRPVKKMAPFPGGAPTAVELLQVPSVPRASRTFSLGPE